MFLVCCQALHNVLLLPVSRTELHWRKRGYSIPSGCGCIPDITIQLKVYMGVVESYVSGTNNTFSFVEVQTMGHISERIHTLARVVSVKHVPKLLVKGLIDCYRRYVWTNYSNSSVYGQWNRFRLYKMHQLMLVLSICWSFFAYTS